MQTFEEPWETRENGNTIKNKIGDICYLNAYMKYTYAHRIVACVNGCAGIENPEAIGDLIYKAELALSALIQANETNHVHNYEVKKLTMALKRIRE